MVEWTPRRICTTGWTMNWYGYEGYLTAGHCLNLPALNSWDPLTSTFDNSVWYQWDYGPYDAGIVLTGTSTPPEFYASDTQIRAQGPVGAMGENVPVCVYGRKSNSRFCGRTLLPGTYCTTTSTGTRCGMYAATVDYGRSVCQGDSGGGVSWGVTAYGMIQSIPAGSNDDCNSNTATNAYFEFYTPLTRIESDLGVDVKCAPYYC